MLRQTLSNYDYWYIILAMIHIFWLVHTYDLLENRCLDGVTINIFWVMGLFSYRSLQTRKMWKEYQWHTWQLFCATFWFSPHFDVICDLLLNWHTETWYLFVIYNIIFFTTNLLSSLAIATASLPLSATLNRCTWRPLSAINFLLWNSWRFSHLTGVILTALAWK